MRTMNIGRLNKRLTFRKLKDVPDTLGQSSKKLVAIAEVWGSLYPVRAMEFYEIQKIQGKTTHKCYIRYREDVDTNCFISCGNKTFAIESVIDVDYEHKILEIMCSEHINKGVAGDGRTNVVNVD